MENENTGHSINPFDVLTQQLNRIEAIVKEIKNIRVDEFKRKSVLDGGNGIAMAVRITGLKKRSIYNLVTLRKIPHSKKGNRLYFNEHELEQWKMSGRRGVADEILPRRGLS